MIKRLKWNVLYGESADDDSDLSDATDDFAERGSVNVQAVLDKLTRNDPKLAPLLGIQVDASCSEEDEERGTDIHDAETSRTMVGKETSDNLDHVEYAEWQECELCPGKRFLSDAEVEAHLTSKRHARALRRMEKLAATERENEKSVRVNEMNDSGITLADIKIPSPNADVEGATELGRENGGVRFREWQNDNTEASLDEKQKCEAVQHGRNAATEATEAENRRAERRKAAVKRKLKALKRRKWEKQMKLDEMKQCTASEKEQQKNESFDKEEEEKGVLELDPSQQKKKKRTERKRQRDTGCFERRPDAQNDKDESSQQKKKSKPSKKRKVQETARTWKEDEEPQRQKSRKQKVGKTIPRDGTKWIRGKELVR